MIAVMLGRINAADIPTAAVSLVLLATIWITVSHSKSVNIPKQENKRLKSEEHRPSLCRFLLFFNGLYQSNCVFPKMSYNRNEKSEYKEFWYEYHQSKNG